MTRGRSRKDRETGPERRCIASGESGSTDRLVRFVLGPDGSAVPDLACKLPGRGAWLTADRTLVALAEKKKLFSRAFRQPVKVEPGLADRLEGLIAARLIEMLALARKAGQAVTGFEKTQAALRAGSAGVLVQASDAAAGGREKLAWLARDVPRIEVLASGEMGLAFGREFAIHAALCAGGLADRALHEALRLSGLRPAARSLPAKTDAPSPALGMDDDVGPGRGPSKECR